MSDRLKFSPDILARLGEELVPDIDQGLIELVKNAYDADATECRITLHNAMADGGSIVVSDNGTGMSESAVRNGWLVLGRSSKTQKHLTLQYGRVPVGDKGLGRLAALRLGRQVTLRTRPRSNPGRQFELVLNWDQFDAANLIEDVAIDITETTTDQPPGTDISIDRVRGPIGRGPVNKLVRSLLLLSDPFSDESRPEAGALTGDASDAFSPDPGFKAELVADEYADLQAKLGQSYFADAEYRIHAELDAEGRAHFNVLDWKGDILHQTTPSDIYEAPPFVFDLWVFILDGKSFSTRSSTMREVQDWLKHVGGVHVYEDAIRVPPYGGLGDDWLDLNLRRSRSPEMRPSTNTSIGRVRVANPDRRLIQKTDRIGYIENTSFLDMRRCCGDALDWASRTQVRERDKRRQAELQIVQQKTERATARLQAVLTRAVPTTERKKVDDAIDLYVKEKGHESKALREELQLYRSLATAGMTSAVFAHEIGRPLKLIDNGLQALQKMIPDDRQADAGRRIDRIIAAKARLDSFVSIPLNLLAKKKRRSGKTNVNQCVEELVELLGPIAIYFKVKVDLDLTDQYTDINGSEALIDGICLNLIMNSINAFQRNEFTQADRRIRIATAYDGLTVLLNVTDNAGGIDGLELDDIWLPGVTTTPEGTGFGLTIVRDSVHDLGGSVRATAVTDFGGAEFVVSLPPMRELFI